MPVFYSLSEAADEDLQQIFDYSVKHHGFAQAEKYLLAFDEMFERLVINPSLGKERTDVKPGLRSILTGEHMVFYRELEDVMLIVRVLHASRDISCFL